MFEVLTDSPPYSELLQHQITISELLNKVVNENYRPKFTENDVKKSLQNLTEKCWFPDPKDSTTFSEIFILDDVGINDLQNYIDDISEINDPVENLISH